MSQFKVYHRKTRGIVDLENKQLQRECSWIPGTPAKLGNSVFGFPVVNSEEQRAPEKGQSSGGGTGTGGTCFFSKGLIDLNKTCDEWHDDSAHGKVVDDPGIEPASFGFDDCRDSSTVKADLMPKDSNFLIPGGSSDGLDEMEGELAEIPFTQLLNSYNIVRSASQESVISTTQHVVDRTTVDTQIHRSTKEVYISIPRTFTEISSSTIFDVSDSQESANSTTPAVDGVTDTNNTENLQTDNITTESSGSQKDVVSEKQSENIDSKKRKIQQKPKRKKHRPRVAVEGKKPRQVLQPKTPKPVTPKRPSSKETVPSKKRKYVRKSSSQGNSVSEDIIIERSLPKRRMSLKKASENNPDVISEEVEVVEKTSCRKTLDFNLENQSRDESTITTTTTHQLELKAVDECLDTSEQFEQYFPSKFKKSRSQRRRRLNTLFMHLTGLPRKRKVLRRLMRRGDLALLIAPPICNQLPRIPFGKAQTGKKEEEAEVICELKKIVITNCFHQRKVMENRRKMELGSIDLESHNEASPSEIFLFTAKDRGSQEALPEQRIDSDNQNVSLELSLVIKTTEEHLQEERDYSNIQKGPPGYEDVWLVPKSKGISLGHKVPDLGSAEISKAKRIISVIVEGESEAKRFRREMISLTKQFKRLKIKGGGKQSKKKGRNAQGPNSGDGTLVPYQEQRNRKRITGKVLLDPDTMRAWNQLMNIKDVNEEQTNPEKEERWRREREIFQGRIESFTARMHLILGDRRFKPWKGSVVDSVVGVYLTQNVSDSLSSSAYMTLASKYPIQTTSNNAASTGEAYDFEGNQYFVTEPEPDRSPKLKNSGEPLDSGIEGKYLVEMDEGTNLKNVVEPNTFEGSSNVQLTDVNFSSLSNYCSPGSCSCSNELPVLENTTLPQDLHYNGAKISSCEEGTSTRMDYGNQASTSERIIDLNDDSGFISLSDSYDPFEMTISPSNHTQQAHYGNQGLTSGRINESKIEHGFNSQSDSHDPLDLSICSSNLDQAHDTTTPKKKNDKAKMTTPKEKKKDNREQKDWDLFRKMYSSGEQISSDQMDSVDWEAVRLAKPRLIAKAIQDRGQHNIIAGRIQDFLNRLIKVHKSINLEWLRHAPPDIVKEYLLEIPGLGLKSVECVRLLSLQHIAFPVDTNVGRIAVRLGWVPLEPLPESLQIHLLEQYPLMDTIQKYLWPRLCNLDQRTLYELHYQLITFGKVFCTKRNPNCGVCPLRGECKHFASAFASARLALPGLSEKGIVKIPNWVNKRNPPVPVDVNPIPVTLLEANLLSGNLNNNNNCEPIIEEPASPEPQRTEMSPEPDLEDFSNGETEEIPTIRLQDREFIENIQNFMETNKIVLQNSRDLVVLTAEAASMPAPKLKSVNRLRTEHLVYVIPDNHLLLRGFERREHDDPCPYLLSIWTPGETPNSFEKPTKKCNSGESELCNEKTCYSCNTIREQNADIVRGTILIPCRTAMRGRFPLNGTYFQVNEVFADHETSQQPICVPRSMIAQLPTQTAYFGTSASSIFRALDLPGIQRCFWRGTLAKLGNSEEQRAPEKGQSSGGGTGTRGMCFYSKGLIDLNKTFGEWHDDSAHGKVIDDPGIELASFSFDDCRDSTTVKADILPKDSNYSLPGGSTDGLDAMENELTTIDTQIHRSTKDVDISIPETFTEVLSSTIVDVSDSQESANSTTPDDVVDGVTDANIAENLQKTMKKT
ncbi:hypothetical protein Q3G72_031991 [Acer saccharum]|nr:hypothetical protein Q3G72_031991 [Acer saccharum]